MKKLLTILFIVLLLPFVVDAKELTISDLRLVSNTSTASIISEPQQEDLNINLDYSFKNQNDVITYSFVVHNISDEVYKIKLTDGNSSHVKYTMNTDEINKNGDTLIELTTTYENEEELEQDKLETNNLSISLIPTINNDASNGKFIYAVMGIAIIGFSILILMYNKKLWFTIPIVGTFIFMVVPTSLATPLITIKNNVVLARNKYCESFKTDDWNQIARNIKKNNTECYNVGDEKDIILNNMGTYKVRIANKKECEVDASCGFIFEFVDVITLAPLNDNEEPSTYKDSTMRFYLNDSIYKALPGDLQLQISKVQIPEGEEVCEDYLYLLANEDIYGDCALDYYLTSENAIKLYNDAPNSWWTRSMNPYNKNYSAILENGLKKDNNHIDYLGVSPVFKIK